jgi:hypothetical protein
MNSKIVEGWYRDYRKEKNIPKNDSVSLTDLINFISEQEDMHKISSWKVQIIIHETMKKISCMKDDSDHQKFIDIFGNDELWHLFSREYHYDILKFLSVVDKSYTDRFIEYIQRLIMSQLNRSVATMLES